MDLGSCRGVDPDVFFPDRGESLAPAQAICAECIVSDECLEYALANGERFGVWGGTSERERRRIRRARRIAAEKVA
ncbi:MAG: WhiB family transcriptional regulator [Acidimicrobiales bacterium]|nr:WhiB family transcriptional regulator [Acidimicrobiales bacterium]